MNRVPLIPRRRCPMGPQTIPGLALAIVALHIRIWRYKAATALLRLGERLGA